MAAPWNGPSRGRGSQRQPTARNGSTGRDQGRKKAGPLDWSIRGAADCSPGKENPGRKASSPGLDHQGLNKKEMPKAEPTNQQRKQEQDPKGWPVISGGSRRRSHPTQDHPGDRGQVQGQEQQDRKITSEVRDNGRDMKKRIQKNSPGKVSRAEKEREAEANDTPDRGEGQAPRKGKYGAGPRSNMAAP